MSQSPLHHFIYLLPSLFLFITSCNGQMIKPSTEAVPAIAADTLYNRYGEVVQSSFLDKEGNLWFGTSWKGVFRYDGKTFTNFTVKEGMCSNTVVTISEDKSGNIWFGTPVGACYYNGNTITVFPIAAANEAAAPKVVVDIFQDATDAMWFGIWGPPGDGGAYRYKGKTFEHFLQEEPVQGIIADDSGRVWMGSTRYDGRNFVSFKDSMPAAFVYFTRMDRDKNIWFGTRRNGFYVYNGKTFSHFTTENGLCSNSPACIYQDTSGKLWIGTEVGSNNEKATLCVYDGKVFTPYNSMPAIHGDMHRVVRTITGDKQGNIWFGTRGGGLYCYNGKTFADFTGKLHE